MTMADTIAVMNRGEIEQMGAPEELYELPRTAFVANFLGQSNLFTGEVVGSTPDALTVAVGGRQLIIPTARAPRRTGTVTVGVRPEKLLLLTTPPAAPSSGVNTLGPGRVTDVSFSGVSTQYTIDVPSVGDVIVFAQNMVFGPVVHVGAEVWVSWNVEHGFGLEDSPAEAAAGAADAASAAGSDVTTSAVATARA